MIAYISTWTLFWLGHWASRLFEIVEMEFLFDIYNWCMQASVNIQDKYDVQNGPWVSYEEERAALDDDSEYQ